MYFNIIEEKHLDRFVSMYFDYKDEDLENLQVKIKEKSDDKILADVFLKNANSTLIYLGLLDIDDFNCKFTLFHPNKLNDEILKLNGNYQHMFYSQYWRRFLAKILEKIYGQDRAEDYAESFLSTNIGNVEEYKKLIQIAYRRAKDNPFFEQEEKGKE